MDSPFIGSEALRLGRVRKHQLRSRYYAVFPGVYLPAGMIPTFAQRAEAAWLWSHREGVLCGLTAARLFGSKWIDDTAPVELVWANARSPAGITTTASVLRAGETITLSGLAVTSLGRTGFDLARRGPFGSAVARVDALANNNSRLNLCDIAGIAARNGGVRGVRQVDRVLDAHDAGAQSPKETWLRLLVVGAGFPRPRTQIPVRSHSGRTYYLDMGWDDRKVALEYDGDHHRTDKKQFAKDIIRLEELAALGWIVVRVAAGTARAEILFRLRRAWETSTLR